MDLVVFIYDGPVCVLIIRSREFAASKMPEFACRDRTRAPSMAILRRNLLMLNSLASASARERNSFARFRSAWRPYANGWDKSSDLCHSVY